MSMMDTLSNLILFPLLTEAKKKADPVNFVPVFDWNLKGVWVWVQQPGGKVIGPMEVSHKKVKKYKGKLAIPSYAAMTSGQIDPAAYSGPKDIYPLDWKVGDPPPTKPPEEKAQMVSYTPPTKPEKAVPKAGVPEGFTATGKTDENGYSTYKNAKGETFTKLPNGELAQWHDEEDVYYIAKPDEDGVWDTSFDSPIFTAGEIASQAKKLKKGAVAKPTKEVIPDPPPKFELPPNYTVTKVTSTHVVATAPDGTKVKWTKATNHWTHADDPMKAHEPLHAAPVKPLVKKPKMVTVPAKATPAFTPPVGGPSTKAPKQKTVLASTPEKSPHATQYTGKVDANGLPLVTEVMPGEEEIGATGLTLMPDDRIARWRPSHGYYAIYDWNTHYGFMISKSGEAVTAEDAKELMHALGLVVTGGKYYQSYKVGDEPEKQPTTYQAPLPPNCEAIPGKDKNGLPMARSLPTDPDAGADEKHKLSVLPDGNLGRWESAMKKYVVWEWREIFGMYNYFPTHPSKYMTLKEVKKLLKQQAATAPVPAPKPVKPQPQPAPSGQLIPMKEKDPHGYTIGSYKGNTYSMLPHNKVGIWSKANGAYLVYAFDSDTDSYYNAGDLWLVPGKHAAAATVSMASGISLARVTDSEGKTAVVLPNGKFVSAEPPHGKLVVQDVNPSTKLFMPTSETVSIDQFSSIKGDDAYKTLKPTGEVDVNGLPAYIVVKGKSAGKVLSMLPDGGFAVWSSPQEIYWRYHYVEEKEAWKTLVPAEGVELSDINSLYMKAAMEKAVPETMATITPEEAKKKYLTPMGEFDDLGYPKYQTAAPNQAAFVLSMLPNGEVGLFKKFGKHEGKYQHVYYNAEKGGWFTVPGTYYAPSEFGSAPAPEPAVVSPTPEDTGVEVIPSVSPLTTHLASKLPDPSGLVYLGSGKKFGLGGAGEKAIYEDPATKKRYIFKPSYIKGTKTQEHFRAYVQEASSALAMAVRPEHIPIKAVKIKGVIGTLQPWVDLDPKGTLEGHSPSSLTPEQQTDVAVDHMMDWLHSQHDSYAGNMVFAADGHILSIDKEQGFKFFGKDKLSETYNPNPIAPFYNKFWQAFSSGAIGFDPMKMLPALVKIEAMGSEDYLGMVQAYADDRFGKQESRGKIRFMKQVLHRKLHLRSDFEKFLTKLYKKRTGEDGEFLFDEGWVSEKDKAQTKYKTVTYSGKKLANEVYGIKDHYTYQDPVTGEEQPEKGYQTLKVSKDTSKKKLFEFLAEAGLEALPVFKDESDPRIKTGSMNYIIVVDAASYESSSVTKKVLVSELAVVTPEKPKYWPEVPDLLDKSPNVEEFSKLDKMNPGREGHGVMHGGSSVEGQSGKAKKWKDSKGEYYLIHFKLRAKDWKKIAASPKTKPSSYTMYEADYISEFGGFVQTSDIIHTVSEGVSWKHDGVECFLATGEEQYSYMGLVWIKVRNTPPGQVQAKAKAALNAAVEGAGDDVFKNPTKGEREVMKLMRLLWAKSPKKADALTATDFSLGDVKAALKAAKVPKATQDAVYEEEVFKGYHSHVLPGRWKKMKGVKFLFNGIKSLEAAVSILKSGLMSINERNLAGIQQFGGSYVPDVQSGSGDGTLCRVVGESGVGDAGYGGSKYSFQSHQFHGTYQAIIHPEVLDRLNTYMYGTDNFGKCTPGLFKGRSTVETRVKQTSDHHRTGNEISFRKGMHKSKILRIATDSETRRTALINAARDEGLDKVNGVPIEDFVVVVTSLGEAYTKYVKPMTGV